MKFILSSTIICLVFLSIFYATAQAYELVFSTFFGGSAGEGIRDVEVDIQGNIYVAGTTRSPDFPTTQGAYDERLDTSQGKTRWGYNSDMFVAQFSPDGTLIWATLIGGPNSEETYGLEVDSQGFVVVHGRGAMDSPVTAGVYQPEFKGCGGNDLDNPHNTAQNAYVCKLSPDGSSLVWGSFFGIDHLLHIGNIPSILLRCQLQSESRCSVTKSPWLSRQGGSPSWVGIWMLLFLMRITNVLLLQCDQSLRCCGVL